MAVAARQAVFLDKDGTLIRDVPYNVDPAQISLYPDCAASLLRLKGAGFQLIVVSNQSGIARGMFDEQAVWRALRHLEKLLEEHGVQLDDMLFCPHHPEAAVSAYRVVCDCRKPAPGLIYAAARSHGIQRDRSWMIGDILDDIEAGNRAGCQTIHVDNGHETEWQESSYRLPHHRVTSLKKAADIILAKKRGEYE